MRFPVLSDEILDEAYDNLYMARIAMLELDKQRERMVLALRAVEDALDRAFRTPLSHRSQRPEWFPVQSSGGSALLPKLTKEPEPEVAG